MAIVLPRSFVAALATNSRTLIRNQSYVSSGGHFLPIAILRVSDSCDLRVRSISSTSVFSEKASSKIEESVQHLKKEDRPKLPDASDQKVTKFPAVSTQVKPVDAPDKAVGEIKKTLWQRFVDECKHYYSGFKLLYLDVRISSKIAWKILNGHKLSRRESKQLVRTTSDLFRYTPHYIKACYTYTLHAFLHGF